MEISVFEIMLDGFKEREHDKLSWEHYSQNNLINDM